MKNKGLIIGGGIAIVALGAFLWMRKKKQMAEEQATSEEGKSNDETSETTSKSDKIIETTETTPSGETTSTSKVGVKPPFQMGVRPPFQPTMRKDGVGKGTADYIKVPLSKEIKNIGDLIDTPLGLEISIELLSNNQKFNINKAINKLNSGERKILNYIALVDSAKRKSTEFQNSLSSIFGSSATPLIDSVNTKILNSVNDTTPIPNLQDCIRKAVASGITPLQVTKFKAYLETCMKGLNFNGSYSFNASGFDTDNEDFAFNGHTF